MKKIYVFGSFIMDHTTRCHRLPRDGESVFGDSFALSYGGKGINQAMMIKRLNGDVRMIGALGKDQNGESFKDLLIKSGFDLSTIFFKEETTGCSNIIIDKDGQNRIIVILGANNHLTSQDVLSLQDNIEDDSVFLLQNEIPSETIKTIINLGRQKHALVILNPAPYKEIDMDTLNKVDIITPNENEAMDLFKLDHFDEEKILKGFDKLKCKYLVMTLGDKGALVYDHKTIKRVKPYKVNVVDTVGAGDAFNGGLVYGLASGYSFDEALRYGNACGALTIQKCGALDSQPSKNEVIEFLSLHK